MPNWFMGYDWCARERVSKDQHNYLYEKPNLRANLDPFGANLGCVAKTTNHPLLATIVLMSGDKQTARSQPASLVVDSNISPSHSGSFREEDRINS